MNNYLAILYISFGVILLIMQNILVSKNLRNKANRYRNIESYTLKGHHTYSCWRRSLAKAEELEANPKIERINFMFGENQNGGHAWLEYVENRGGKKFIIGYDPTYNKIIFEKEL